MEIRFDPLNEREAEAVARWLNLHGQLAQRPMITPVPFVTPTREEIREVIVEHRDVLEKLTDEASAQSATGFTPLPVPDAPLAAAADLFPSAPVAEPAGRVPETSVSTPPAVPAPPQADVPSAPAAAMNPADVDKHGLPWDARIHSGTKAVNADGSWRQRRGLNDPELVKRVEAELRALMAVPVSASPLDVSGDTTSVSDASSAPAVPAASTATAMAESSPMAEAAPIATVPVVPPPPVVGAATGIMAAQSTAPVSAPVPNVPPPPVVPVPPSSVPATAPIPSPPAVPAPPIAAAPAAPITFADVMRKVTSNIASAKITEAEVHAGLTSIGLAAGEIGKMNGRPDLIKQMSDYLDQLLISKAGV